MAEKKQTISSVNIEKKEQAASSLNIETGAGIHLRAMSILFMAAAFVAALALFVSDAMVNRGYKAMEAASDRYMQAKQAAMNLEAGSDSLTESVRCFVVTGDLEYLQDFFVEVKVTRRRDGALSVLEDLQEGSESSAYESLAVALDYSNELMDREYYAMRLMLETRDYDLSDIPQEILSIEMEDEDLAASPAQLQQKAENLVFDSVYASYKGKIRENVALCTDDLIETSSAALEAASLRMDRLIAVQTALTVLLLVVVLCLVFFISTQVRAPLTRLVARMRAQEPARPAGAAELRFVTRTYNEYLKKNLQQQEQLTYEAMHDALTGLYNRSAYEMFLRDADKDHIGLMIVDVDKFKSVNDTYGHDVGDKVLRRVADILRGSFRSVDTICRIGGDEFVVIISRAGSSMSSSITEKITRANRLLQAPADGLPPTSLSAGVAFSDRKNPCGDIFKDADTALFRVKEKGRCGCAVYE